MSTPNAGQGEQKFKVVDCDTHFWQPIELWEHLIAPAYRKEIAAIRATLDPVDNTPPDVAAAAVIASATGEGLKGKYYKGSSGLPGLRGARMKERAGDHPDARLEWMAHEGIDACVIYPSSSATLMFHNDSKLAAAACRALNRWSAEFASHAPDRLKPCLLLPWYDPERAVEELAFAVELGLKIAFATPTPGFKLRWSDPAYDPLWRAMQDAGVVLTFHDFTSGRTDAPTANISRPTYKELFALRYLCGHTIEAQLALADLMYGGVFNRFPKLRIGFVEAHVAWLPGWLAMLDCQWQRSLSCFETHEGWGDIRVTPTEMFRRQGFIVAFPDDLWIPETMKICGEGNVTLCTDYPHPASRYGLVKTFDENYPDIDAALRAKLMNENAIAIFGLE